MTICDAVAGAKAARQSETFVRDRDPIVGRGRPGSRGPILNQLGTGRQPHAESIKAAAVAADRQMRVGANAVAVDRDRRSAPVALSTVANSGRSPARRCSTSGENRRPGRRRSAACRRIRGRFLREQRPSVAVASTIGVGTSSERLAHQRPRKIQSQARFVPIAHQRHAASCNVSLRRWFGGAVDPDDESAGLRIVARRTTPPFAAVPASAASPQRLPSAAAPAGSRPPSRAAP